MIRYLGGLLIPMLFSSKVLSQFPDYHVRVFDEKWGIKIGRMLKVIKDPNDFIWMLHENFIQRFDGKNVKTFHTEEELVSLEYDSAGRIWAASNSHIFRYKNDHFGFMPVPFDTVNNLQIGHLFRLPDQRLWVQTNQGFYELDPTGDQFKKIELKGLPANKTWETGFFLFSVYHYSLFMTSKDSVHAYNIEKHTCRSLPRKNVSLLFALGDGLAIATGRNSESYWLEFDSAQIKNVDLKNVFGYSSNLPLHIRDVLHLDATHWLIASHFGLLELDITQRRFHFIHLYYKGMPLEKNPFNNDLFLDQQNNVWLIHRIGLICFKPKKEEIGLIRNYETDEEKIWQNTARNLTGDEKGNLWISTSHGFGYWDLKKNLIKIYPPDINAVDRLNTPSVRGLYYDGRYVIMGTSTSGIWFYDPVKNTYRRPLYENSKKGDSVKIKLEKEFISHIAKINSDNLLIASSSCYILDLKTYLVKKTNPPALQKPCTYSYQDSQKKIWVVSNTQIHCLDSNLNSITRVKFNERALTICEYKKGEWFVGTEKAMYHLRSLTDSSFDLQPIPLFNKLRIEFIIIDVNDKLWVGTDAGLGLYDRSQNKVEFFDYADNVQSDNFSTNAFYLDKKGMLFLGGDNGINFFYPGKIKVEKEMLNISIMNVIVNQNDSSYFDLPTPLQLKNFQNSIEINFAAPFYRNLSKLRYKYFLEGTDTNWIDNGNNNTVRFTHLNPGHYNFRVAASINGTDWFESPDQVSFVISPPFWKKTWFMALAGLLFGLLFISLYRRRLSSIKKQQVARIEILKARQADAEKELQLSNLNHDLAASRLTALRSQMNPHFIFNALNSVQQYMLQGNVTEANKYLSKFSKLQREILNHSDRDFIQLEKELELLNLYLQLEQLRFDDTFSYSITTDESIDPDEIKIPPMLVQPFVENAIWHGLMPKQGERKVTIHFALPDDQLLICSIKDNGIGREAATRLRQATGNGTKHESKGLSLVYERLNILRQQYNHPFEVSITDLVDKEGTPEGTLVTLTLFAGH